MMVANVYQINLYLKNKTLSHTHKTNILIVIVENHGCSLELKCWLSFMS